MKPEKRSDIVKNIELSHRHQTWTPAKIEYGLSLLIEVGRSVVSWNF